MIPPENISFFVLSAPKQILNMKTDPHSAFGASFGNRTWKWMSGQAQDDGSQKTEPALKWLPFRWDPSQATSPLLSWASFVCGSRLHPAINHTPKM